jgi:hypothetical protein
MARAEATHSVATRQAFIYLHHTVARASTRSKGLAGFKFDQEPERPRAPVH